MQNETTHIAEERFATPLRVEKNLPDARVNKAEALRYIGYTGQAISAELDERFDAMIARCEEVSHPAFAFRIFPAHIDDDAVRLEGSALTLSGSDIRTHLAGACAVAVMVCTLGFPNERELARLSRVNSLDALMFNTASSSLVESAADICEASVAATAHQAGLVTNSRFSPGYGDLPLALQPQILDVLEAQWQLGVTALESNLLVPQKSTTALIGLFSSPENVQNVKHSCAACPCAAHCTLRKAGTPCYR